MRSKAERAARPLRGRSEGLGYVPTSNFHGSRPFGLREKWHLYYKCIACTVCEYLKKTEMQLGQNRGNTVVQS